MKPVVRLTPLSNQARRLNGVVAGNYLSGNPQTVLHWTILPTPRARCRSESHESKAIAGGVPERTKRREGITHSQQPKESIMSFTDQDKHVLSDIVMGFSLAIVGVCRALEQQQNVSPGPIAEAIHTEMDQVPTGSSGHSVLVKDILTSISNGLKKGNQAIAKVRFP
jgi:hypothetical protein